MIEREVVARRFSAAAAEYEGFAAVQALAIDRLMPLVDEYAPETVGSILDIGCGTGMLARRVAANHPGAALDCLDVSSGMLAAAAESGVWSDRTRFIHSDFLSFKPDMSYSMVVSSSSLHWITPLDQTFAAINLMLIDGGLCAVSMMGAGTFRELRAARAAVAPDKPLPFLPSFAEVSAAFDGAAWELLLSDCGDSAVEFESAESLLSCLNALGVTGGAVSGGSKCRLGRGELRSLRQYYDDNFGCSGGGVRATYEIILLLLRKKTL